MSNIGPNLIRALDLAHLEGMKVVTNELNESVILTAEGEVTEKDLMVGLYGSGLESWKVEVIKELMSITIDESVVIRETRPTLHQYYKDSPGFIAGRQVGKSALQMAVWENMAESFTGKTIDSVIIDEASTFDELYMCQWDNTEPDNRDKHSWKREKFESGGPTPPSESKRAALRAKRKKKGK